MEDTQKPKIYHFEKIIKRAILKILPHLDHYPHADWISLRLGFQDEAIPMVARLLDELEEEDKLHSQVQHYQLAYYTGGRSAQAKEDWRAVRTEFLPFSGCTSPPAKREKENSLCRDYPGPES